MSSGDRGIVAENAAGAGQVVRGVPEVLRDAGKCLVGEGGTVLREGKVTGITEQRLNCSGAVYALEEANRPSQKRAGDRALRGRVTAAEGPVVRH